MNKVSTAWVVVTIVLTVAGLSVSLSSGQGARPVFESSIIPCGHSVNCGGFPQNIATMTPVSGRVEVFGNGAVNIILGCNCSNQMFEVFFGSFTSGVFQGSSLGNITTDSEGHFGGPITTSGGGTFAFAVGPHSGQFIFNLPGLRSEFITGFVI
jgi:hypothetical protein